MSLEPIKSWHEMVQRIQTMDEEEIKHLLNYEVAKYNRKMIVMRLHQRYCKLRRDRERQEMSKGRVIL